MTHTPGPWAATNKGNGTWRTDVRAGDDGSGRRVATTFVLNAPDRKRGESICSYRKRYDRQARQNEANARLIAAAPELLELLEESRDFVAHCIGSSYCETDKDDDAFLAKLDAVIAKAKGETA